MARIRSLRPEFWSDRKMADLSPLARLLYMALWNYCDDAGRGRYLPKQIAGFAFPFEEVDIPSLLSELIRNGRINVYEVAGELFFCIPTWPKHQKPQNASQTRIPEPPHPPSSNGVGRGSRDSHEPGVKGDGDVTEDVSTVLSSWDLGDSRKHTSPASQDDVGFEEFWNQYPARHGKKIGKAKTAARWRSLSRPKREAALAGVRNYAEAIEAGATIAKDPFRWISQAAWEDWQTPASVEPRTRQEEQESIRDAWRRKQASNR